MCIQCWYMQHTTLSQLERTPLLIAIERSHHDIMRLLLDNGADPNRADVVNVILLNVWELYIIVLTNNSLPA